MKINKITRNYNMTVAQAEKIYDKLSTIPIEGPHDYRIAFYDELGETIRECYDWEGSFDFPFTGTKKEHQFFNRIYKEVITSE